MRKVYLYMLFTLAVAMPWLNGCIREDRDDCKGRVMLRFRYVGDGTTDIFPDKIEKVTVYVYSADNGALVGVSEYDKTALTKYQGADIYLFPGRYEVVCWGNILENSRAREGDRVAAPEHFTQDDIATNDRLYYGSLEVEVPETLAETDCFCDFVSSHVKMQVRLEGFVGSVAPGTGVGGTPDFHLAMTNLASYVDFDNVPAADEPVTYYPELTVDPQDPSSYIAAFNTLRFNDDNDIMLQVHSGTRAVLHEFGLADFLDQHQIGVEGYHEAMVSIRIRANATGVVVEDWESVDVTPGFDN